MIRPLGYVALHPVVVTAPRRAAPSGAGERRKAAVAPAARVETPASRLAAVWQGVLALFGAPASGSLESAETLFDAADYDRAVGRLRPGHTLRFSDGVELRIGKLLGEGGTTKVFATDDPGVVLRLPRSGGSNNGRSNEAWHVAYASSHARLETAGVPVVRLLGGVPGEYALVERVGRGAPFRLDQFLDQQCDRHVFSRGRAMPAAERGEMIAALHEFARKTAGFSHIADFAPRQVAWDPVARRWLLLDWGEERHNEPARPGDNVFWSGHRSSLERLARDPRGKERAQLMLDLCATIDAARTDEP